MSHLEFHYTHTLRALLIDRYHRLEVARCKDLIISSSSKALILTPEEIYRMKVGLEMISGSRGELTRIKRSLAAFGIKEDMVSGMKQKVGDTSFYFFLDFLCLFLLPQRTSSLHVDTPHCVNFGIAEMSCFPQFHFKLLNYPFGITLTLRISSLNKEETQFLLRGLYMPLS